MKNLRTTCSLLAMLLAGCATTPGPQDAPPGTPPGEDQADLADLFDGDLAKAHALREAGYHELAVGEYRRVAEGGAPAVVKTEARIGQARCFLRLDNPAAAVRALTPPPVNPASDAERRHLAWLGEALLRADAPREAESPLEVAVAGFPADAPLPPWAARCCANLAGAYLRNGKPPQAVALYYRAALAFEQHGDLEAADYAQRMARDILAALGESPSRARPKALEPAGDFSHE